MNLGDPGGNETTVRTHSVILRQDHAYIHIVPNNQSKYANDPRFIKDPATGKIYATVGAGAEEGIRSGSLVSDINRTRDANLSLAVTDEVGLDFPGDHKETIQEDEMIEQIFAAESIHNDSATDYDLNPRLTGNHNSNSFVSGFLRFLGIEVTRKPKSVPGWSQPIPEDHFPKNASDEKEK